eukprot:CAMPEP_0205923006 /NCGR_PEP_ID=MMETSP1325-20131115/15429_1 /ASSEMBLY_ACC=CAM_ASM_000708 /TAXON_ID=236786 /ORGANISM="Florenciella sp., Strain RCC1007" /LENGTH=160 /DNA_ID=CAMNT_0053291133 /DNA_START=63 /DNA_END=545 /DNA_ORIENTATION=+
MEEWGKMGFDRSKGSSNALNEVDPFEDMKGSRAETMRKKRTAAAQRRKSSIIAAALSAADEPIAGRPRDPSVDVDDNVAERDWESMFNKLNVASGGMDGRLDALERQAGSVVELLNTKADKAAVDLLAAQVASLRAELANMRAELRAGRGVPQESWSDGF